MDDHTRMRTIEPRHGFAWPDLVEVWEARDLIWVLFARNFRTKYKQTALGFVWALIPPLMRMGVYSIIFGALIDVPSEGLPYPLFVFPAILCWSLFARALTASSSSLHAFSAMIQKVYFPRLAIPITTSLYGLVDFCIALTMVFVLMAIFGHAPGWSLLLAPVFVLLAVTLGLAIGLWVNGLIMKYRDVRLGLGYAIGLWMYLTPVIYPSSVVPPQWETLYLLNPMASVVAGFRWAMLGTTTPPDAVLLGITVAVTLVLLTGGLIFFDRNQRSYIDRM